MQQTIVAGWNMPGCMPESEPAECESFEQARAYIVEELNNVIEGLYTGFLGDSNAPTDERDAALEEEKALNEAIGYVQRQSGEFGFQVGQYYYFVSTL
jgi:hypothetical protein